MKLAALLSVAAGSFAATAKATELGVIERMMRTGTHTCLDKEGKWPGDNYRTAEDCAKLEGGQWVERQTQADFDASVQQELAGLRAAFADEKDQFVQALIRVRSDHTVSATAMKYWADSVQSKGCGTLGLDKVPMTGYFQDGDTGREYFKVHTNMKCFNDLKADTSLFYDEVEVLPNSIKACPSVLSGYSGKEQEEVGLAVEIFGLDSETQAMSLAKALQSRIREAGVAGAIVEAGSSTMLHAHDFKHEDAKKVHDVIVADSHVHFVSRNPTYKTHNKWASYVTQSHQKGSTPIYDHGITGAGQVVGVGDSGLDHTNCQFYDPVNPVSVTRGQTFNNKNARKVVQYMAFADAGEGEDGGHGTHVAGSVAGNSANPAEQDYDGMAPDAKVAFFDIGVANQQFLNVPNQLERTMFPVAATAGAKIHTNSWGANANTYSSNARSVDIYSFDNQDYLVLVAAGNSGATGTGTIGTPATAKNCIAVGASMNTAEAFQEAVRTTNCPDKQGGTECEDNLASFSSVGPCSDGRICPDLVAPGYYIMSARSATNPTAKTCGAQNTDKRIVRMAGTSMATPVAAGNAALVRQYFEDGFYPLGRKKADYVMPPMGALVKAIMINSAEFLKGNDFGGGNNRQKQGHGLLKLKNSMYFEDTAERDLFVVGDFSNMQSLTTGETRKYELTVIKGKAGNVLPLKATLVWHDAPASSNSNKHLVNDLDLKVTAADGQTFFPNGGNGRDNTNNAENILVSNPKENMKYEILVTAQSVPQGPQPFALVITGSYRRDSTLFTDYAPIITQTNNTIVRGNAGQILVTGKQFSTTLTENSVNLTCNDGANLPVKLKSSTKSVVVVEVEAGWTCGVGPLRADVTTNGFVSATTQVADIAEPGSIDEAIVDVEKCKTATGQLSGAASSAEGLEQCGNAGCAFDEAQKSCVAPQRVSVAAVLVGVMLGVVFLALAAYVSRNPGALPHPTMPSMPQGVNFTSLGGNSGTVAYNVKVFGGGRGGGGGGGGRGYGGGAEKLKPNWFPAQDPGSGDTYYYNAVTGQTTWDKPVDRVVAPPQQKRPASMQLPPNWERAFDQQSGDIYYFNAVTGASQWDRPRF